MLKLPEDKPQRPIVVENDANTTALYESLKVMDSRPNIMTLEVFRRFEPLFRKDHGLTQPEVKKLTDDYVTLVDFYKETNIVVSSTNMTVVLTLPSIFTPVRSLTINERNASLVATNQSMQHSNVPKYSLDAFRDMFNAFRDEQINNVPVIKEYKERYAKVVTAFFDKYSKSEKPAEASSTFVEPNKETASFGSETSWDID